MNNFKNIIMKKILLTGVFAFATFAGFSQSDQAMFELHTANIDLEQKWESFGMGEAEFNAIKDEAYANPNFLEGSIFQGEKLARSSVPMRYNAFADEIEIKKNPTDKTYGALIKDPDVFVKLGQDLYVFIPFQGSNEKGGYFNVLSDGKTYDLYKKTTSIFQEPKKAETSYRKDTPPSFIKSVKYYLVENGTFLEMPSSKSKVLKMMDSKKSEIKSYIKTNRLDLDKEEDLIKIVSYFDSLL